MAEGERFCVGAIAGVHGVRGLVKIKSFTGDPLDLTAYGPLTDESGRRRFQVTVTGRAKGLLIARIEGVEDREAAQALRGARLYAARAALPEPAEEEYYHADLIGLEAQEREQLDSRIEKEVGVLEVPQEPQIHDQADSQPRSPATVRAGDANTDDEID